ncbi:MAG: aspartate aminotransferase family protein [Desulfobacteraceae bacterium]|nr:aspartate aminotransferase family protein [Desulfobacteraceae bacterium]
MDTMKLADQHIFNTYARYPLAFTKGEACTLYDEDGKAYSDFIAGIAVCNLGHAHSKLIKALTGQAQALWHVSNLFYTRPQAQLAAWLTKSSFADRVFFANSGAEANEAGIKLARKYFKQKGEPDRYRVVAMEQSFHGRTMATLSATGQEKIRKGFDPVLEGFDFAPFNDLGAIDAAVTAKTCAVMIEPIQGEGGVVCPEPGFFKRVRELCDQKGCLLILDEVQTGIGRTGKLFAHEHFGIQPDIMTLAKALANGLPIGAMLAKEHVAQAFGPGSHATTFGGTPLITSVALKVLETIHDEKILDLCCETGAYFKQKLIELQKKHSVIRNVRGYGLLLGVELGKSGANLVKNCMQKGFLINCVQDNVLRLAPPLIISKGEIDALIDCLDELLDD